ncbi:ABC transporter permease subunit [Pseudomonas mosselii]|uniref:ABC transporter permease subunit n=1 Tax=Pseudomonas mosselii TaxID=78327 RepID=A0AA42RSZ0_9PSED|nr:ABC transporter permease subunit [Pseudomonas mosselii]MDH1629559.1 ABC transporter permease subunit [Pseudomonas mosselii]
MRVLPSIIKRELYSFFETPVAYVFIVAFLLLCGFCTFYPGALLERNQADLAPFFQYLPWLCLVLMPALAMRLWSDEIRTSSMELLLSLPVSTFEVALGKLLAAWLVAALALLLTFPLVLTVNVLGQPDNGVILCGYLGSLLLCGCFLAIGGCVSALTRHQSIAFVVAVLVCLLFIASGAAPVQEVFRPWLAAQWLERIAALSVLDRYMAASQGVLQAGDLLYFASQIILWWLATALVVELKRAG